MKSNTEDKSSSLPEEEAQLWDFYVNVGVKSADELRQELKLDDPKSRWYVRDRTAAKKQWTMKGVTFSSFRDRYKQVISIALPSELVVLGKSYVHAYSMSKDVHFTPHDVSANFQPSEVIMGGNRVGLLILALIVRCQHLLGCVPEGMNKRYREMHDCNAGPAELVHALKTRPAETGDIVWIHGGYAEVLNVTMSKYGYPAYYVRYVERSPLKEVPEDWFAGFEVKLIAKKETVEKNADAAGEEILKSTGQRENRAKLLDYTKRAVVRVSEYTQQLRLQTQNPPPTAPSEPALEPGTPKKAVNTEEPPALPA